jgi:hypothetical protein
MIRDNYRDNHLCMLPCLMCPHAGSTPPNKLAQAFLEKAEAVRAAALEAAVGRELERAAEAERQAERETALLHTALDMQVGVCTHVMHLHVLQVWTWISWEVMT